jgi:hypothetical protein
LGRIAGAPSEQFELLQAARDEYITQSPAERASSSHWHDVYLDVPLEREHAARLAAAQRLSTSLVLMREGFVAELVVLVYC